MPSAFSVVLNLRRILLQLEYGPGVCGILCLIWVGFFFVLLQPFEKILQEFLSIRPRVSFVFKEVVQVMQVMADVALYQTWCDACPFVDVNSLCKQFYRV